jgi:hypothetical protein
MRRKRPRIPNKNSGAAQAPEKFKAFYKGSTIEISSEEHAPDEWSVSFEIPATLFRSHIAVGRIIRSAFMTRDDALAWARKEIDSFNK